MKRRDFLTNSSTLLGVGLIAQALDSCSTTSVTPKPNANFTIDLTNSANGALNTVGGVLSTQGIYIVRTGQSTYIALAPYCTHEGCGVSYNSSVKQFICPCHNGKFDLNGNVVSGPPPSPLSQYKVTLSGTTLTVTG
ncbi:MAG: Rieske 2Fe-2S domain-containing protein [Bacteroidetes bacterium]|nr:Rieske 2Fe-2S domain-containing protein [Bacteroidota bacterium]